MKRQVSFFLLSAEFFSFFRSFNGSKIMKNVVNSKVPKSKFCYPNHGFKVYRKVVICVWKFIYVDQDSVSKFVPRNIISVFKILIFCLTYYTYWGNKITAFKPFKICYVYLWQYGCLKMRQELMNAGQCQ